MLEPGEESSMETFAHKEGISCTRVRQVLTLLQLPPEMVERVVCDGSRSRFPSSSSSPRSRTPSARLRRE
jgi:hypothetical protein